MTHNAKELILAVKESELKPGNQVAQAEIVRTAKDFLPVIVTFLVKHFVKIWKSHCIKNEVSHQGFFSKCDQIRRKLRIWAHLLKNSLMGTFIFCAMS